MSLKTQAKVLRALDEQRFEPVGAAESIQVDVRVVASTNKNLEEEIERGNFREDLFYRLNVIPFHVPPLRERMEDVRLLADHFLKEFTTAYGRKPKELTEEALRVLEEYPWPGNVRELRNLMERIVIMNPQTAHRCAAHPARPRAPRGVRSSHGSVRQPAGSARSGGARLHSQEARRSQGQCHARGGNAGPGAQPPVSENESSGNRREGIIPRKGAKNAKVPNKIVFLCDPGVLARAIRLRLSTKQLVERGADLIPDLRQIRQRNRRPPP